MNVNEMDMNDGPGCSTTRCHGNIGGGESSRGRLGLHDDGLGFERGMDWIWVRWKSLAVKN
jgi:hypothetical protein